ncbi:glycosyltransferase family 2 protein [Salipiger marinus]|uniref:Glycosyl transferase family 2 n=1 Tax=Salipiger marinus TaxID=555512 RepID=A0A1G8TFL7_9RHOB|nr:glycosyltransferase family 2 protein [Salipiger marinus]SDJ40223.1 Glycosyl transferase family 2 [Salipiger marinus]
MASKALTVNDEARVALVSCMRNEGVFSLEWLAYHIALGFERIFVVTNDCRDGSNVLFDRLEEFGVLVHVPQDVPEGASPQDLGMDLVLAQLRLDGQSHVLHIDSDEFLHVPEGLEVVMKATRGADVVPVPWRLFGDGGMRHWKPGDLVVAQNLRAEPAPVPGQSKSKCFFRVDSFARATDHNPLEPLVDDPVVMNPDGDVLENKSLYQKKAARFRPHDVAVRGRNAVLFHYAIRSEDCFLMKNDRGDGQGKRGEIKYHLGSHWHRMANRNDVEERAMLSHVPKLSETLAEWRSDPELARLEKACQDWFLSRRAKVLTPERRKAWSR